MAYIVAEPVVMDAVSTTMIPWRQDGYTPWFVAGKTSFGEPMRREVVFVAPCRTVMLGPVDTSGNYRIPSFAKSPVPRVSS